MRLSEKHIIDRNHVLYKECDRICFASKNIYNLSLYKIKKDWLENKSYKVLNNLYDYMKDENCYKALNRNCSQQTIRMVQSIYKSFFKSIKSQNVNHTVSEPHYLNKKSGRYVARFTINTVSRLSYKKLHQISLSQTDIKFYTKVNDYLKIQCVDIVPNQGYYEINVIYKIDDVQQLKSNRKYLSIDLGVNSLATCVSNKQKFKPFIINGRPIKHINQFYNKQKSHYQYKLEKDKLKYSNGKQVKSSKRIQKLSLNRSNKINDYLHKTCSYVVEVMCREDIRTLIIGYNKEWKQNSPLSKVTNQNYVQMPYLKFINILKYKCQMKGIAVQIHEESYTSKCSFLDFESVQKHDEYKGKRIKRGLYKSSAGKLINADVNGAYNIMRKAVSNSIKEDEIEGLVINPSIIKIEK